MSADRTRVEVVVGGVPIASLVLDDVLDFAAVGMAPPPWMREPIPVRPQDLGEWRFLEVAFERRESGE
jgi:hypothetical protein